MIKRNAQPIGDILSDFFEINPDLKLSVAEHRVVSAWKELLGEGVSMYTQRVYLRKRALHVQLSSSVLRAELLMSKQNLIDKLNEQAGMVVIDDLIIR